MGHLLIPGTTKYLQVRDPSSSSHCVTCLWITLDKVIYSIFLSRLNIWEYKLSLVIMNINMYERQHIKYLYYNSARAPY